MLLRVYRLTDRFGLVILKSSAAFADWLLAGIQSVTGTVRQGVDGLLSLVLILLTLLITGIGALLKTAWRLLRVVAMVAVAVLSTGAKVSAKAANYAVVGAKVVGSSVSRGTQQSSGRRRTAPSGAVYDDLVDVKIAEDPLKIQNRRLSMLVLILGIVVICTVLWATDPSRTPARPISAVVDNPGSSLILEQTPLPTSDSPAIASFATPIPTATPPPLALRAGGTVAYTARERGQYDIWAVSVGTRNPLRILNDVTDDRDPAWSSDGTKLAFASRRDGNYEVYTYELSTQAIARITYDLSFQANPRWSNDGLWLAYESYQGNNLDVYAVPVDGSEAPVRITDDAAADFSPVWSPDGRQIAFVSWREGNQDIYIFNLDTLETINFTATPGRNEDNPAWSPDGDNIAFSAVDVGRETIFVQSTESRSAQLIGRGRTPSWSPDGSTLIFAVDADDKSQTYLYAVPFGREGGISTEILAVPYGASDPVWSREILPPTLVNSGGLPLAVTDPLYIEQEEAFTTGAPYRLNALLDVEAPSPYLSDRVNDSFNALRVRVLEATGVDYLATLDDAWWDLERLPEPGVERRNWHMTGRAFSITRSGILGFPAPLEIVREDTDTEIYWRVYLRVAEEAQSGSLGEPLRRMPWDFLSRSQGDVEAYNQGGRLKSEIPAGYYVDFTQLAADYGWLPRVAGTDWRANSNSINYWMFWKPDGLSWYNAMLEIHTEGELINFAPTPAAGQ